MHSSSTKTNAYAVRNQELGRLTADLETRFQTVENKCYTEDTIGLSYYREHKTNDDIWQ